jgi:hypothetical protein
MSTTFNIGGVSFHPAPTGVRVAYAEGYAASFIPAPDPQLSVVRWEKLTKGTRVKVPSDQSRSGQGRNRVLRASR